MKYYFCHLISWPYLPADFDATYDSAWIWLPFADVREGSGIRRDDYEVLFSVIMGPPPCVSA
jgi:hypothetical protein